MRSTLHSVFVSMSIWYTERERATLFLKIKRVFSIWYVKNRQGHGSSGSFCKSHDLPSMFVEKWRTSD